MFWQKRLDDFIVRMGGHDLPLRLRLWNGREAVLGPSPIVTFEIKSISALRRLLRPSLASLGQAYVDGLIDIEGAIDDVIAVAARLSARAGRRARRAARRVRHTRRIDAEAIAYHYDVSNAFYRLWLDEEMVYSCAYFRSPDDSLEQAQRAKIDHILAKLRLAPGQRLLDIGCGWGALVMRAAEKYGARAVGITLSRNQHDLARSRVAAAGLADRVDIRLQDYRDVKETFDRVVSVGMLEHVGLKNLRGYFAKTRALLADGGVCLNHGITSTDPDSAESPFGGGEFIERYVFPHGELPHIGFLLKEMAAAGLEATDVENLRRHYALTARHWSRRFERNGARLREMVGEKRYRIWRAYLAGCAYGFEQDWIALHQVVAVKAGDPRGNPLPLTRDYMYPG
ncbi:MAG: cyclopropane-fatty-acyl-phospholipid synthase [Rhodocyclaceae bacterium]|uniref:Class I SAM-dependent methyltransferase n=1 Tax=Candidatus Desulfobacillus denitrificans TaxID=2608985 RepID=A0A809QZC1_9PROT|nr:class I SAM-dependent methyltransferase [Candidatus Desulfobacillus denitrificans]GJQ56373.1 MAG: cyclopropane-fatty-acyl-phospholipid synthase [Rhodocyclaceae bacterium]